MAANPLGATNRSSTIRSRELYQLVAVPLAVVLGHEVVNRASNMSLRERDVACSRQIVDDATLTSRFSR